MFQERNILLETVKSYFLIIKKKSDITTVLRKANFHVIYEYELKVKKRAH